MHERELRLGGWMPFGRCVKEMKWFCGIDVSKSQVREATEAAGAGYVAMQSAEAENIARTALGVTKAETPELLSMNVDGSMVQLVNGNWVEVKTMVISEVNPRSNKAKDKASEVQSSNHSYFSRTMEAKNYINAALVESERRGVLNCERVCAITDGAEWIQTFISAHRPDAIRILDFYHAAEYLAKAGQAFYGEGDPKFKGWYDKQRHELRHGEADKVMKALETMANDKQSTEIVKVKIEESIGYLKPRLAMIQYAQFDALGYPVGSGAGEACHTYVIQQRMKQTGMRWAKDNVNSMVALRNMICNDRWDEGMSQLVDWHYEQARLRSAAKHTKKQASAAAIAAAQPKPTEPPLLSPDFKLRPSTPWRDQPVGKAKLNSALR